MNIEESKALCERCKVFYFAHFYKIDELIMQVWQFLILGQGSKIVNREKQK
jgi:hypothetical protein